MRDERRTSAGITTKEFFLKSKQPRSIFYDYIWNIAKGQPVTRLQNINSTLPFPLPEFQFTGALVCPNGGADALHDGTPDLGRRNHSDLPTIQAAVRELITTRQWLKNELFDRCAGAGSLSESETLKIGNLKALIESPMSWRLKKRSACKASSVESEPSTPMTKLLRQRLTHFHRFSSFIRVAAPSAFPLIIYWRTSSWLMKLRIWAPFSRWKQWNQQWQVGPSIAVRRVLFLLLSPTSESSDVIQDALNYVPFYSVTPAGHFRIPMKLFAGSVSSRSPSHPRSRSTYPQFRHEFDVSREVKAVFDNPVMREKLFVEAQSSYVKMLAALANNLSVYAPQNSEAPRTLVSPYLDPLHATKDARSAFASGPWSTPLTEQELHERQVEIDQVNEHNSGIANFLQISLYFLRSFNDPKPLMLMMKWRSISRDSFNRISGLNFPIQLVSMLVAWDARGYPLCCAFWRFPASTFPASFIGGGWPHSPQPCSTLEIMGHLGALHGKALQIGVKPDWFFHHRYTHELLTPLKRRVSNRYWNWPRQCIRLFWAVWIWLLN